MKTRQLGRGGLTVSALGLGCMGLSFGLSPATDKREGIAVIRDAFTSQDLKEIDAAFAATEVKGPPLSEGLTAIEDR